MSTNFQCKRLICMILVLCMVIGMMPMHVHAAQSGAAVDAAIIFSDLHTSSSDYKESTVKGIMTAFKNAGLPVSSVTSGGDAFSVNADSTKYTGDPTKLTGYIQNVLGNVPVNYVWSDHDRYGTGIDKKSSLVYGAGADGVYGTADDGNYYIYSLSMGDLCTYDRYNAGFNYTASSNNRASKGFTATVPEAIENFKAAAATLSKDRPLLIVSHQPLFDNRNDNGWAEDWCDAINEVAAEMDVAFFYGHNHKYDTGSDYYYAKGSTMPVATRKLTSGKDWNYDYQTNSGWQYNNDLASVNKVLNFTHLCAGYLAPSSTGSTSNTTREGTALAVTIYEDSIRFTTYNSKGIYTGSYAVDKTITRDFAVSEPELLVSGTDSYFVGDQLDLTVHYKANGKTQDVTAKASLTGYDMNTVGKQTIRISYEGLTAQFQIAVWQKVFTDSATGVQVEVSTPGATALTVNTLGAGSAAYEAAFGLLSGRVGYDLTLTGHVDGNQTIVTMPVPAGVTKPAVYNISDDGKTIARMNVTASANGSAVSFATDHFGNFIIGQEQITEDLESGLVAGGSSYADQTVYVRVDAFENGGRYLIIGEDNVSNANPITYTNNNGKEAWNIVTIQPDSVTSGSTTYSKGYIEYSNSGAIWTASGDASKGFILSNNGKYIGGTDANTLKGSSGEAVKVIYDASAVCLKTASGTTRYLYYSTYSGENWKWATSIDSSSSSRKMWIYKEVTVRIPTSVAVTYTMEALDLTHVLSTETAQLQYNLLADGVKCDLPSGGKYTFSVRNDVEGVIAKISDTGVITFTGIIGTCDVKVAYSWSDGTVYKYVTIATQIDPDACDHDYTIVTVDATCTNDGVVSYSCSICQRAFTETIPALGHDYTSVVSVPTCTQEGCTTHTCVACGYSYVDKKVTALGHSYVCSEGEGCLIYTCICGDTYTETPSSEWMKVSGAYVLDTDGIDVGAEHRYIVVGSNQDYALTLSGSTIGAARVTIQNNRIVLNDASAYEFYFARNSKESNTYLLTRDGSKSVYHMNGNMYYGNDNKGYWYFGSHSNGSYQLYDYDNCNWYLNYGYVWGNDSTNRFAVSYNSRSVRLFKYTETYARLDGALYQFVTDADGATVQSILNQLSVDTSKDGVNVSGTAAVTADMVSWDRAFDGTTPGIYTATVTYDGVQLGTIKVIVDSADAA